MNELHFKADIFGNRDKQSCQQFNGHKHAFWTLFCVLHGDNIIACDTALALPFLNLTLSFLLPSEFGLQAILQGCEKHNNNAQFGLYSESFGQLRSILKYTS